MDLTWEMLPQAASLLFTAAFANGAAFALGIVVRTSERDMVRRSGMGPIEGGQS